MVYTAAGKFTTGKSARPYEPLPLVLGEHRVFPDYAARPFAEFVPDPTAVQEVINNTPSTVVMLHAPFSVTGGVPIEPWTKIYDDGGFEYSYYGDHAARTYASSSTGTVTQPHTFVVRVTQPGGAASVATYEDYLALTGQAGGGVGGGGG